MVCESQTSGLHREPKPLLDAKIRSMGHSTSRTLPGPHGFETLVGKPVTEFLSRLCVIQPAITAMRFAAYTPEPKLSDRLQNLHTSEEADLREQATVTCRGNGIPFWDALLGICMKRDSIPERFLESAGIHSPAPPVFQWVLPADQISTARMKQIVSDLPAGLGLVVSSRVQLRSGDVGHIPMLDFRCPCSPANASAVRKILELLGHTCGILVESGRSYHYYGVQLLSTSDWTAFMAKALLFAPFVDPRYVAHRLADGECRLKLAASREASIPSIIDAYTVCV
jgi:hypothetical protein